MSEPNVTAAPLVLHVLHHLRMGGMENGLINLINHMAPNRYRHAIVCIEDYSDFRERIQRPGVEIYPLHRARYGVWHVRRQIYQLCRQLRPALIHTRNQSGLDALLPARLAGIPCVHSEHGWDVDNLNGHRWKPLLLRRVHRPLVKTYITVSKHLEQFLVEGVGVPPGRITQIYNGVDVARFAPSAAAADNLLPADFSVAGRFVIGTVGRVEAVKDQATLLRAFAHVCGQQPESRLVIAGDGPLLAALKNLAASLGIAEKTVFLGASERVPEILQRLDVFVLPSLNEGISNTILESLATALPVVATAVGGNGELVEDRVNGRLFASGEDRVLADILLEYAQYSALRVQHGAAARAIAVARFSLAAMTNGYAAVYDQVLQLRR